MTVTSPFRPTPTPGFEKFDPAAVGVGQAFNFSVSPLDVWSAVASTGWAFGEGSSASGASGSFAYGAAVSFAATVTSTDSRGNQTSAVFGSFAQEGKAGLNRKRFSGKIGRRSLRPGRYRARLRARDAAGNASRVRNLAFRVVRR